MKTQFTSSIAGITIFFAVFLRRVALGDKTAVRGSYTKGVGNANTLPNINDGSELFVRQTRNDEESPFLGIQKVGIMPVFKPETFAAPKAAATSGLSYGGGYQWSKYYTSSLIGNVKVIPIWWGGSAVNYRSDLEQFYGSIVNSSWFGIMNEYSTTNTTIGMGTLLPSYVDSSAPTGVVTGSQIEARLSSLISSGAVPKPDKNTYYAIHMSPQVTNVTMDSGWFCIDFCGFHYIIGDASNSWPFIAYGVMPDVSLCKGTCSSSSDLDGLTMTSAHELAEVVTDSFPGYGYVRTSDGWEIGDICAWQKIFITAKNGTQYAVQKLWSNKAGQCISPATQNVKPTTKPTKKPTRKPTKKPTRKPTMKPTKAVVFTCPEPKLATCSTNSVGVWSSNGGVRASSAFVPNTQCANVIALNAANSRLFCCYDVCPPLTQDVAFSNCRKISTSTFMCS